MLTWAPRYVPSWDLQRNNFSWLSNVCFLPEIPCWATNSVPILGPRFPTKEPISDTSLGRPTSAIKVRRPEKLSPREREVIQLLALSKGNKDIATALGISTRTIETYRARIMLKLRVQSLHELVHYAIRNGIIDP